MMLWARLIALLRGVETRHWVAVGGSVLLHVGVLLGLKQAPPPPLETVTFEIALQPPEAELVPPPKQKLTKAVDKNTKKPAKKLAEAKKPKKPKTPKTPAQTDKEPHTLEAAFKQEKRASKEVPPVALPQEISTLKPELAELAAAQQKAPAPAASLPAMPSPAAVASSVSTAASTAAIANTPSPALASNPAQSAELSPPAANAQAAGPERDATTHAGSAQPALALTAAKSLAAGPTNTGAEPSISTATQGTAVSQAGPGVATFSGSAGAGGGLNLAAGRGANVQSASESAPMPGGAPDGVRLTASGTLSSLPEFPQSQGGLAAGQLALPASSASLADGQNPAQRQGQSSASLLAGGASASPLNGPVAALGQGKKGAQGAVVNRAGVAGMPAASGQSGVRLSGSGHSPKGLSDLPEARNGHASARSVGGTGQMPGASALRSQSLVPGEPGSGPQWAVVMAPVQVGLPVVVGPDHRLGGRQGARQGQARAGQEPGVSRTTPRSAGAQGGADESTGAGQSGRVQLAQSGLGRLSPAQTAGGAGSAAGSGGRSVAPIAGQALMGGSAPAANANAMSRIKPVEQKIMREDSRVETLDVLAPSTYCPLPFYPQPDNRPPPRKADQSDALPSYSSDNPPFIYPIMANIQGTQGKLVVRVQVLANGLPGEMLLKQSSGNAILDKDARETLARWRFSPARKGGQAVDSWVDVPVIYRLSVERK
jgi:protein TonB